MFPKVCVATKRIFIHESIYKPFVEAMVKFTNQMKVGSSHEKDAVIGPIQNSMQYEKVKQFFADSKVQGHRFVAGKPDVNDSKGYFVQPAIIDNPPSDSRIIQEEPFGMKVTNGTLPNLQCSLAAPVPLISELHLGPIVPCQPWSSEEEVIARANNTNTGLGACVWSGDVARAERIASKLEAGTVWVNSWEKPTPQAFFGGHKESGIGGEWGKNGLLSYCNVLVLRESRVTPRVPERSTLDLCQKTGC